MYSIHYKLLEIFMIINVSTEEMANLANNITFLFICV